VSNPWTSGAVARTLLASAGPLWGRLTSHPFVVEVADGSLEPVAFDRWIVADHFFVVGFRRFLAGLVTLAPDQRAADVLAAGLAPLQTELDLFRREAYARQLDLTAEPGPTTLGYTAFLRSSLQDGYGTALAVLYGAEKAYYDAWSAVRATASRGSSYWPFVDNWSSDAFAGWVAAVARLLDPAAPDGPTPAMALAFDRVVRFELRFWTAVHTDETW
jgi:formylaminopyrimidine deformylase / aminopyrimidine aminohydrolase